MKTIQNAEEIYFEHYKKYSIHEEEMGIGFNKLKNISVYYTPESLPANIKLPVEHAPKVNGDFYQVIALFKDSNGRIQIWKLKKGNGIQFLNPFPL